MITQKQTIQKAGPSVRQQVKQLRQSSVAAAYSTGVSQSQPIITRGKSQNNDWIRIVHKELVANITGSAAFAVPFTFPLNPGMSTFCKWLATQSVGWETYEWNSIEGRAFTRTGSNVPGSQALIPDYDAADSSPTDEFSASTYKDLAEDVPWKDLCCLMPHSRLHPEGKRKFIRYGNVTGDIKTYDCGNLFVSTIDGTAVPWSKLWVYYDVTLFTPQLPPGGVVVQSNELHVVGGVFTTANAFSNPVVGVNSNAGMATVPVTGEVITFNVAGRFLVVYNTISTTNTVTGLPAISASGSFVTSYYPAASGFNGGIAVAGSASATTNISVCVDVVKGTTLTYNDTIVAGTAYDLTITALTNLAA